MALKVRRIVTGHDSAGDSIILWDGVAETVMETPNIPGFAVVDLWETATAPANNTGNADAADRPVHLEPARTGTICRVVEFPPDSVWQGKIKSDDVFGPIGAAHAADSKSQNPMMHKTPSVDYAICLSGEIWAVMDKGETRMVVGDVLIQRGTNHSWSVRTDKPARVAFILVGANPV